VASAITLGFDLRVYPKPSFWETWPHWPEEARKSYLLRPDTATPLSIDPTIWPSIIDYQDDGSIRIQNQEIKLSNDFWCHVVLLRLHPSLKETQEIGKNHEGAVIKINLETDLNEIILDPETRKNWSSILAEKLSDSDENLSWQLLGYDVADCWRTSGIMVEQPSDKKGWRDTWASYVNQYGIFDNFWDANRYREYIDRAIPEHKPFLIFGLYSLEKFSA